ncbi:MAG: UDP-2,3-diacylglucosamine diphosphatase LpxI, partial [Holosporaceae bacterium]|nr:UDP-2,3-diacylglucosamine diphosphatase LpxI [Holosporaceae bacterium]
MSSPNKSVVGIICGGGDYPRLVARACVQKDIDFCLVFLNGFCNEKNWPSFKNISINLGEIEKAINFLVENKVKKIVFAGGVKRPKFNQLSLDEKGKSWLMKLGKAVFSGDDTLLKSIAKLLEKEGFEVISGTSLLEDIFFPEGIFSRRKPSKSDYTDIKIGLSAARELGILDLGQSVVVHNGEILGKEDNDGTNALLEKCGRRAKKGGILVKVSKPQQDDRLDLPTIGVETIQTLHKNGFDGIIVEADRCIVINKKEVVRQANELNVFIGAQKIVAKKIFMIAGEASGDYLGGKLMQSILQLSPDAEFYGVGGEHMRAAGLKELFSINRLSIIGIFEVIGKLFSVKKMIDGTVKAIHKRQPDVVVTIDSSGFTHRVAKKVKKIESRIPIIHYVAPPVWAWRPWRAKSMHKFIDKLMVLFPFERQYFIGHGLETVFVGHPIATDPDFERPQDSNLKNFLNSIIKNRDNAK